MRSRLLLAAVAIAALTAPALAQPPAPNYTRTEDVIYGRKFGTALTMDVIAPKEKANGRGVIWCVSGGWFSAKEAINPNFLRALLDRGYTVFAAVHGSQPKFTIPEVLDDMRRAVRYIRANAKKYQIDPDKLGVSGGSAGGHLSLMLGVAAAPGNPESKDPVDRETARVAAVGCFFPPTDFLNYGREGETALGDGTLKNFKAPFAFAELDTKNGFRGEFVPVTDEAKRREIGRRISPVYHVTKDSAPALVIHGDADKLVPIQQAELMAARYKAAGVPFELVTKKGAAHGWAGLDKDVSLIADWFDKYLLPKAGASSDGEDEHTADTPEQVKKALAAKSAVLIDVREQKEWDAGHLADAALLPLSKLRDGVPADELGKAVPKGKVVYLHCKAGGRCLTAAELLRKQGYDARPLKEGYADLLKAGFPQAK